jgi:hypothetical protein
MEFKEGFATLRNYRSGYRQNPLIQVSKGVFSVADSGALSELIAVIRVYNEDPGFLGRYSWILNLPEF